MTSLIRGGALDHRPDAGREFGQKLGLLKDRAYGDWQEMLAGESGRDDRVDLVTVRHAQRHPFRNHQGLS